jgi:hypothetical protein
MNFDKHIVCLLMVLLRRIVEHQVGKLVSLYDWFYCWENSSNCLVISLKLSVHEVRLFMAMRAAFVVKQFDCFFYK